MVIEAPVSISICIERLVVLLPTLASTVDLAQAKDSWLKYRS